MKIAAIKNHPAEGLGYIEQILNDKGIEFEYIEAYKEMKEVDCDAIIILGGPMGVYEADKYPFLKREMEYIRKTFREKPILGICLGAQLIAAALGAKVYPFVKEVGWRKVVRVSKHEVFDGLPDELEVFQWHGDTFDLPEGARLIYAGDEVRNQAFVLERAVAIQFHLEMTLELIRDWLEKSKLKEEEKTLILQESVEKIEEHNRICELFMSNFINFIH